MKKGFSLAQEPEPCCPAVQMPCHSNNKKNLSAKERGCPKDVLKSKHVHKLRWWCWLWPCISAWLGGMRAGQHFSLFYFCNQTDGCSHCVGPSPASIACSWWSHTRWVQWMHMETSLFFWHCWISLYRWELFSLAELPCSTSKLLHIKTTAETFYSHVRIKPSV